MLHGRLFGGSLHQGHKFNAILISSASTRCVIGGTYSDKEEFRALSFSAIAASYVAL